LVFLELSQVSQRVLSLAPISMMGQQISAAIVAMHAIVLWSIMPKVFPMTAASSVTSGAATNLAGIWALTLIITLALSVLFRVVVEIPSELLGRATLIFFYGQDDIQQLSTISPQHMEKARKSGYLMPLPSLGNPMAKLGLTKVPW
jgi:Mg2+/Co2+ transporter CorB